MNVKELMEVLEKLNPENELYIFDNNSGRNEKFEFAVQSAKRMYPVNTNDITLAYVNKIDLFDSYIFVKK